MNLTILTYNAMTVTDVTFLLRRAFTQAYSFLKQCIHEDNMEGFHLRVI